jgi:hypothetical protein
MRAKGTDLRDLRELWPRSADQKLANARFAAKIARRAKAYERP